METVTATEFINMESEGQKLRTLIVDDERLARKRVRRMLSLEPDLDVVGECESGTEAVEFLKGHPADILFLDVQMPGLDGFGVLEAVGPKRVPVVVFTTAFDEYALRAFEFHAFDYLLKPFDRPRLQRALDRARAQLALIRGGNGTGQIEALLSEIRKGRNEPGSIRFPIKTPGRVFFVRMEDIDWVEAADNYVCLHVGTDTHLLRETMNAIETRLDTERFARIHRSTIVNLDRVKELRPWFHGEYVVLLRDGTELTLSRSYRDRVLGLIGK